MKLSNLIISGLALSLALVATPSMAKSKATFKKTDEQKERVVMEQVGHINYAENDTSKRQVASATTIVTRIYQNKAVVEVSQAFANDSKDVINGEYFFPLPYNSQLLDFQISTDFQASDEMPNTTVTLMENDQFKVRYGYELVDDSPHHASVMGFPAKANSPLIELNANQELVAKK